MSLDDALSTLVAREASGLAPTGFCFLVMAAAQESGMSADQASALALAHGINLN
jgi:hypothetical protein